MSERKKVAVIGAGASGLVALKSVLEEGLDGVCFEKTEYLGGLWRYHAEDIDGIGSVMKTTVTNTSKEMTAFSDFPPPRDFPNYMPNTYVLKYLQLYATKFKLEEKIKFRHQVEKVSQSETYEADGSFVVEVTDLRSGDRISEKFDGVMVCNGHHFSPTIPNFPGKDKFEGEILHTHSYKSAEKFVDKSVVVAGAGNSGIDAAVELSFFAKQVYLSTRHGCWIFPRLGPRGQPLDISFTRRYFNYFTQWAPYNLVCSYVESQQNAFFDHGQYELKPKHRIFSSHVVVNELLPSRILSGSIKVKGGIKAFQNKSIQFEGEKEAFTIDAVVCATGYKIEFPFLEENLNPVLSDYEVKLYKLVFPPNLKHTTLGFIGLENSTGGLFPISEMQARWFVQNLAGNLKFSIDQDGMKKETEQWLRDAAKKYVCLGGSMKVDWIGYMDEIAQLIGVKPNFASLSFWDPKLLFKLIFGPCLPYQYRLQGPHKWSGARDSIFTVQERIDFAFKTRHAPENEMNGQ